MRSDVPWANVVDAWPMAKEGEEVRVTRYATPGLNRRKAALAGKLHKESKGEDYAKLAYKAFMGASVTVMGGANRGERDAWRESSWAVIDAVYFLTVDAETLVKLRRSRPSVRARTVKRSWAPQSRYQSSASSLTSTVSKRSTAARLAAVKLVTAHRRCSTSTCQGTLR